MAIKYHGNNKIPSVWSRAHKMCSRGLLDAVVAIGPAVYTSARAGNL